MIGLLPAAGSLPEDSVPIDARTRAEYEAGHLPGAIHLAWEEFWVRAPRTRARFFESGAGTPSTPQASLPHAGSNPGSRVE